MDGPIKSLDGFYKLGEEVCTLRIPKVTRTSPFFLFVTRRLLHKVTALFIIVLIPDEGKKAECLNVQIEHLRCQTIVDGHSCYVQPVCIGN